MAKKQDNLLKEAIADAKAVRETALANAKLALTEAFTPKLQSMLSTKLRNEMEGEFGEGDLNDPVGAQQGVNPTIAREAKDVTANAGADPEAEKAGAVGPESGGQGLEDKGQSALKLTEVGDDEEEIPGEEIPGEEVPGEVPAAPVGDVAPEVGGDVAPEVGGDVAPEVGAEMGAEDEEDTELEAIIRELEAEENPEIEEPIPGAGVPNEEIPGEEIPGEEEEIPAEEAKDVTADSGNDPEKGLAGDVGPNSGSETAVQSAPNVGQDTIGTEEGELDLESLVKEIEDELGDEDEKEDEEEKMAVEALRKEITELKKSLKEHRGVVVYLRDRLNEINLLNAKLLFSNKLFRANSLTESQKLRVA